MFRAGIVGCGGIAQVHSAVLNELEDVQLVACADIKPERAQKMAEKYGCVPYSSLDEMLDHEKLDVVHICTPHYLHTPMAEKLAERNICVFTEKPPVISWEQWDRIRAAGEKTRIGVCFQNRYNANVQEAQRRIASGEYGALLGARAFVTWHRTIPYYTESGWRGSWETEGGGALINQSIHTLDLLIRFLGKPDTVEAHMFNHHLRNVIEVEDTLEAYLVCNGKTGLFYATTSYVKDSPVIIELELEKARMRLEDDRLEIITEAGSESIRCEMPKAHGKAYWGSGHTVCIADYYDSLKENRPFDNALLTTTDTVETMLKIYDEGRKTL